MTYREAVQIVRLLFDKAAPMLGPRDHELRVKAVRVLETTYVEPDDQEEARADDAGRRV